MPTSGSEQAFAILIDNADMRSMQTLQIARQRLGSVKIPIPEVERGAGNAWRQIEDPYRLKAY